MRRLHLPKYMNTILRYFLFFFFYYFAWVFPVDAIFYYISKDNIALFTLPHLFDSYSYFADYDFTLKTYDQLLKCDR